MVVKFLARLRNLWLKFQGLVCSAETIFLSSVDNQHANQVKIHFHVLLAAYRLSVVKNEDLWHFVALHGNSQHIRE